MAFDKSAPLEPAKAGLTRNALGVAEELGEIGRVRQNHYLRLVAHSATHGIQTLLDPGEKAGTASTRQTGNFLRIGRLGILNSVSDDPASIAEFVKVVDLFA